MVFHIFTGVLSKAYPLPPQTIQLMDQTEDGRAPEFTWGLMSLKVMDGEEVKFRCEVSVNIYRLRILFLFRWGGGGGRVPIKYIADANEHFVANWLG